MAFSIINQSLRRFSSSTFFKTVPGLQFYSNFLNEVQQNSVQQKSIELYRNITTNLMNAPILSLHHNLRTKEYYSPSQMLDNGLEIRFQHFKKFSEDGHTLTYFVRNNNIPNFVKSDLITRVMQIPEVMTLGKDLNWNFTFNTYSSTDTLSNKVPGFHFHKDIDSNGVITIIYSIGTTSEFQIRHPNRPDSVHKIPLITNSLILLSGESRWDHEHCVVPMMFEVNKRSIASNIESIVRVSLVLGCA